MNAKTQKIVGIVMMLPALGLAAYLALSVKMWVIAVLALVFSFVGMVGYHMFRGNAPKDAVKEVVKDVKEVVADIKDGTDKKVV